MTSPRSFRASVLAIAAAAVLLLPASGAGAETVTGESATIAAQEGTPSPELTLVRASASYEPTAGSLSFTAVTSGEPQTEIGGKPNQSSLAARALKTTAPCSAGPIEEALEGKGGHAVLSYALLAGFYNEPTVAEGLNATPISVLPVQKTLSGGTTNFTTQAPALKDLGFDCAVVTAADDGETKPGNSTSMVFPLAGPPKAPPPPAPAPVAPGVPSLSVAQRKPVKLKAGKWKTVKVSVTNTSGTDAGQGSLRIKAPKGVLVKPEKQKLPALAAGASWTVSVRVELTKDAKKRSTLTLTADASGVSAKGSLVLKLKD